jgi:hypothetical protein
MNRGTMLWGLAAAVTVGLPAVAQQPAACTAPRGSLAEGAFGGFENSLPLPPCAEPSLPPLTTRPTAAKARPVNPPAAGPPPIADHRIASTELGFERGIGPAPGRGVTWRGRLYLVVDVTTRDGRPTFAGGSRFVITTDGGALDVGLKAIAKGALEPELANATPVLN